MEMGKEEIWKNVEGYPGYYISTRGRVKSSKYKTERILKPIYNCGYLYVNLCCNGKVKGCRIHRLVANAFIPNPMGLPCVNHKDELKTHNFVENLEWCSYTYNNNYGTKKERLSDTLLNHPALSKSVRQITLDGEVIATYPSIQEAARISGLSKSAIWSSANGVTKKPRKYNWEFVG